MSVSVLGSVLLVVLLGVGLSCGATPTDLRQGQGFSASVESAPDSASCTGYPEPRVWLESQAWWDSTGLSLPEKVGGHIHVGMCWPATDVPLNGPQHFVARAMLHNQTGKTSLLRVAQEGTVKKSVSVVAGPAADTTFWVPFDVDLSTWSTGRREFRWTVNVPKNVEGKRQYQSTGWLACVRACSPTSRTPPYWEARGWYTGHDYQHARFLSPLPVQPVSGLWTFKVRLVESGPGGVFIDPSFHIGIAGTRIASGGYSGTLTINTATLTNGVHHLVLVSSDGKSAGVQVVRFTVTN